MPKDDHNLPLDPDDYERTELYREDDPEIDAAIHAAKTEVKDPDEVRRYIESARGSPPRYNGFWLGVAVGAAVTAGAFGAYMALRAQPAREASAPATSVDTSRGEAFRARLAGRASEIHRCLGEFSGDLAGAEELAVRLAIRADGTVASAEMVPRELNSTAAGACILAIAREVRFAAGREPVTVRIPISIQRK